MSKHLVSMNLRLTQEVVAEIVAIAKLAGVKPEMVIRVALATASYRHKQTPVTRDEE